MTSYNPSEAKLGAKRSLLFRLEASLIGLLTFSAGAMPRLIPALFGLLGLVAALNLSSTDWRHQYVLLKSPLAMSLAIFVGYLFINATWAPDPVASLLKAATVLGLVVATFLTAASYSLRAPEDVGILAKCALAGLLTGAAFLLIEIVFDDPIMRFINNHIVKVMRVGHKNATVVGGQVTQVAAFVLNRNATSMMLLLIPGALFTAALSSKAVQNGVLAAVVLVIGLAILLSQSGTSTVAFFLSAVVLGISALSLQTARFLLVTGWVLATMLAVPLAKLPYDMGWQHWTWLPPESVAARFYIWKYSADDASKRMLTGIGIRGMRALHLVIPVDPNDPNMGYALKGRAARHPHNVFLQTWLELGAIGAVLLLSIGLAGLWALRNWPVLFQASGYALFAACCAIGLSGFDMFQTWLIGATALAWSLMLLAKQFGYASAAAEPQSLKAVPGVLTPDR
jgi:O-antigen ligase